MLEIIHLSYFKHHRQHAIVLGVDNRLAAKYATGQLSPRYPVPAIPTRVVFGDDYMYDTLYIETTDYPEDPVIVALWDFNFDRCMDFYTPLGEGQFFPLPSRSA